MVRGREHFCLYVLLLGMYIDVCVAVWFLHLTFNMLFMYDTPLASWLVSLQFQKMVAEALTTRLSLSLSFLLSLSLSLSLLSISLSISFFIYECVLVVVDVLC